MKLLHRSDLFSWSAFDEGKNVDFNGTLWVREGGNIVIDPMPMSDHDRRHLADLGGVAWIIMTNSDHTRWGKELAEETGAQLAAPSAERAAWPYECDAWLATGDTLVAGLQILEMQGSKTPGELALIIDGHTLVTGDLVRAHRGGRLMILPDPKLADRGAAVESVRKLAAIDGIEAVLVGDGWPVFRDGQERLKELAATL